jgi:hypothetical protein
MASESSPRCRGLSSQLRHIHIHRAGIIVGVSSGTADALDVTFTRTVQRC